LTSVGFSNNDLVFIWQTMGGSNPLRWEVNKIVSGGGTANLVMQRNLDYTYVDNGGNSQCQIIKIPQYTDVTINAGVTISAPNWNQDVGGLVLFAARGTVTINGVIQALGLNGQVGATHIGIPFPQGGHGAGYWGGHADQANYDGVANAGVGGGDLRRGGTGYGDAAAIDNGGTGGSYVGAPGGSGGGGGGHRVAGDNGTGVNNRYGKGGTASGNTSLSLLSMGGGGGGGCKEPNNQAGGGGGGGGAIVMFTKILDINNQIRCNGGVGAQWASGDGAGGGGGAGGSILIMAGRADLGSNYVRAYAGAAGADQYSGGGASIGRIALHYNSTYTGTTATTMDYATQDSRLREASGMSGIIG
jgi:hypothetical protein